MFGSNPVRNVHVSELQRVTPFQMSRLEAACGTKPPGTSIKSFLLGAKRKTSEVGASPSGTLDGSVSPAAAVSTLSRDKTAESTLAEGAEKSPETPLRSFLLGTKRKTSEGGTSSTGTQGRSVHSPQESSVSRKENSSIASVQSSSEHQLTHQGHNTSHTLDANHPLPVSHTPMNTMNNPSNETKSIDVEVLLALPEDMRDQVIAEYRQQGYTIPALPGGGGSDGSPGGSAAEPQPGTSGVLLPGENREQEASSIVHPEASVDGPQTSLSETARGSSAHTRESEVGTNNQNVPLPVFEARNLREVGDTSNSNSNFSVVSESAQDSLFITSFSQVCIS